MGMIIVVSIINTNEGASFSSYYCNYTAHLKNSPSLSQLVSATESIPKA